MPRLSPVSYKVLECIFELDGFRRTREHGDHIIYTKPDVIRPAVIPKMSRERYFELLEKCR